VRLIRVTIAEPVYRARKAHTNSLSFSSHFHVVAPSNQSFSLLFTHLLQLLVPANSSSKLCLLIDKIILYYCNYCLCFQLASSYLAINRFYQSFLLCRLFSAETIFCLPPVHFVLEPTGTISSHLNFSSSLPSQESSILWYYSTYRSLRSTPLSSAHQVTRVGRILLEHSLAAASAESKRIDATALLLLAPFDPSRCKIFHPQYQSYSWLQ